MTRLNVSFMLQNLSEYKMSRRPGMPESTIVSEGFKGGTRGAPLMPRDAVSRTANVERNGGHKWVSMSCKYSL